VRWLSSGHLNFCSYSSFVTYLLPLATYQRHIRPDTSSPTTSTNDIALADLDQRPSPTTKPKSFPTYASANSDYRCRRSSRRSYNASAFNARALNARALNARAFNARAFNARALNARALNARAFNARAFNARAFNARALNARAFNVGAFNARALNARSQGVADNALAYGDANNAVANGHAYNAAACSFANNAAAYGHLGFAGFPIAYKKIYLGMNMQQGN
jgi:hypothetical protein